MAKTSIGDYIVGTTFASLSKALPVKRVFENDKVVAFWHPKPFWDKHILIVPKRKIRSMVSIQEKDLPYIAEIFTATKLIVEEQNWDEYTLLVNGGNRQEVNQLHFHLCTGKELN
ncbi:HIT domain-containing protein [Patescibacteria group bacterium]|nr:HIT domain-containing protein [Patescibacteria group bacterium]